MASLSGDIRGHGYPRPFLHRDSWTSLNGPWDFALDLHGCWYHPRELVWNDTVLVPFAPETDRSGIGERGYFKACWYRRTLPIIALAPGERLFLHFAAVDYRATVWVDGAQVMTHEGGYTPFSVELTLLLREGLPLELV